MKTPCFQQSFDAVATATSGEVDPVSLPASSLTLLAVRFWLNELGEVSDRLPILSELATESMSSCNGVLGAFCLYTTVDGAGSESTSSTDLICSICLGRSLASVKGLTTGVVRTVSCEVSCVWCLLGKR